MNALLLRGHARDLSQSVWHASGQFVAFTGQGTSMQIWLVPHCNVVVHICQQLPRKQVMPDAHWALVVQPVFAWQAPGPL